MERRDSPAARAAAPPDRYRPAERESGGGRGPAFETQGKPQSQQKTTGGRLIAACWWLLAQTKKPSMRVHRRLELLQLKLADLFQAGTIVFETHVALIPILSRQLLRTPAELLLQSDVAWPLHRVHETRQILLLLLHYANALFLQLQRLIEQRADVLLVRRRRSHLHSELLASIPLLRLDLNQLRSEAGVRLLKLSHLRVGETDALLGELRNPVAKLLLERRPLRIRRSAHGLGESARADHKESARADYK